MRAPAPKPVFFPAAAEFRRWLENHHATAAELHIGFYKQASGKAGMTYKEAVDEALCFGWIDGVVRRLDQSSYMHRFSPRKAGSIWSNVNVGHVVRLTEAGRMHPAGLAAYQARDPQKVGIYAFEQRPQDFPPTVAKVFRANKKAWEFWNRQPPGYRRTLIWWIISAKQGETRRRRLEKLIAASAVGKRLQ